MHECIIIIFCLYNVNLLSGNVEVGPNIARSSASQLLEMIQNHSCQADLQLQLCVLCQPTLLQFTVALQ